MLTLRQIKNETMKQKMILFAFAALVLTACNSNKEYAYNESASNDYYQVSRWFEDCYQHFIDGKYETNYEYNNVEVERFVESNTATDARLLKKNVASTQEHLNLLKPSKKAQAFHDKLNEYFQLVGTDFADIIQAYADLDCDCITQKDSISQSIKDIYKRISTLEDECLEVQKKYIESVGGHGI
jgi:hypothetical protein